MSKPGHIESQVWGSGARHSWWLKIRLCYAPRRCDDVKTGQPRRDERWTVGSRSKGKRATDGNQEGAPDKEDAYLGADKKRRGYSGQE